MNQPPDRMAYEISTMKIGQLLETASYQLRLEGTIQSKDGKLYCIALHHRKNQQIIFRAPLLLSLPRRQRF